MKNIENLSQHYNYNIIFKIKATGYALDSNKVIDHEEAFNDYEKFRSIIKDIKKNKFSTIYVRARDKSHRYHIKQAIYGLNPDTCSFNFEQP